jgi:hypothetical protein
MNSFNAADLEVTSIVHDPQPDESEGFPDFKVTGTYKGEPFELRVGLSFEDRDFDIEWLSGFNPYEDLKEDEAGEDERIDLEIELQTKVNDSPAYKKCWEDYEKSRA